MNENPAAKLFKEPAIWPCMAPWWLIPSTDAAALLNVKPATLHTWRVRGYGPPVFPPMYVRPTQGNPLYYQFGALRAWAASKLGMAYTYEDQCIDFLAIYYPSFPRSPYHIEPLIHLFQTWLEADRRRAQQGKPLRSMKLSMIHELDPGYSRQPRIHMAWDKTGSVFSTDATTEAMP